MRPEGKTNSVDETQSKAAPVPILTLITQKGKLQTSAQVT